MSLAQGAAIELEIDRVAAGGDGVGRHEGCVVFVPRTAPGDLVRVTIERAHARYARGRLSEILVEGPERRPPPCPYFSRCGGCSWMHLTEQAQKNAGTTIVRDALERIGNVGKSPPIEELPSPRSFEYRSRARIAIARGRIGFYERGSHRVVDVERCAVLDAPTQRALDELRARRPQSSGEIEIRGFGEKVEIGDRLIHVPQGAFFQANGLLWAEWQRKVAEACGEGERAVELYGGTGFYTVLLESRFDRVIVVDRGPAARGARLNTRAEVVDADVDHWGPQHLPTLSPDLVLVNPPRAGCSPSVIEAIRAARPTRLVYVSCDPSTFARDVRQLSPDYRVETLCRIDALPQTHHVELLAVLVQTSG